MMRFCRRLALVLALIILIQVLDVSRLIQFSDYKVNAETTAYSFNPIEDAYVQGGSLSNENFGLESELGIKDSLSDETTRKSYLEFDITGVETISSAKLKLYCKSREASETVSISVYGVCDDSWLETGINFTNAPSGEGESLSTVSIGSTDTYYEFDVTTFVQSQHNSTDNIISLEIKGMYDQDKYVTFSSRESESNKPVLEILPLESTPSLTTTPTVTEVSTETPIVTPVETAIVTPTLTPTPIPTLTPTPTLTLTLTPVIMSAPTPGETPIQVPTPLSAPTLTNSSTTSSSITLIWDDIATASEYAIDIDGEIINVGNVTTYVHTGLTPNTEHTYKVAAIKNSEAGMWSQAIVVTTPADVQAPTMPSNLTLTHCSSDTITIIWDYSSDDVGVAGYDIYCNGIKVETVLGATTSSFNDTGLNQSSLYSYTVRAFDEAGNTSLDSIPLSVVTLPAIPTEVIAVATDTSITVSWNSITGAATYDIEVDGVILEGLPNNSYNHFDVLPNSNHTYRVRAKNSGGNGEWSELITKITMLSSPKVAATIFDSTKVNITWDAIGGASEYEVTKDGVALGTTSGLDFTDEGLSSGISYVLNFPT